MISSTGTRPATTETYRMATVAHLRAHSNMDSATVHGQDAHPIVVMALRWRGEAAAKVQVSSLDRLPQAHARGRLPTVFVADIHCRARKQRVWHSTDSMLTATGSWMWRKSNRFSEQ